MYVCERVLAAGCTDVCSTCDSSGCVAGTVGVGCVHAQRQRFKGARRHVESLGDAATPDTVAGLKRRGCL